MYAFLKKDILVLLRDRTELAILLLMPFVLIAILGFALSGLLSGNTEVLKMEVAVVQQDNEEQGIEQFSQTVRNLGMPLKAQRSLATAAKDTSPSSLLRGILNDDGMSQLIAAKEMGAAAAERALEEEQIVAILTIPENFTFDTLQKMMLDTGAGSELQITVSDHGATQSEVFHDILAEFAWSLNFESAIAKTAGAEAPPAEQKASLGGLESVSAVEPIGSFQYYTIGMAVMFSLFVAATISGIAFVERQQFVFDRILLSNHHPFIYLGGKAVSAAIITFCQLQILFFFSSLIFGAFDLLNARFWFGMALIAFVLAVCVGALAAFLTTLTIRFDNDTITNVFAGGVVTVFAFLGGSFTPTEAMPAFIQNFGQWTPNGAALSAFLTWMQHLELGLLWEPLSRIVLTAALLLIFSLVLFPRKGAA